MKWLLYIGAAALAVVLGAWAVFTFAVKPAQKRSPQEAAAGGLALNSPLTTSLPQQGQPQGASTAKPNATAEALRQGGNILAVVGNAAGALNLRF